MDLINQHLTSHDSTEVMDAFVGAAASNQIAEELFIQHLLVAAHKTDIQPALFLVEVSRRVATGHYNEIMLGSLPSWVRPLFGMPKHELVLATT